MKWLRATDVSLRDCDFRLANVCILASGKPGSPHEGLTVFEPRSLDSEFVSKLRARAQRPEFAGVNFTLYLPDFLKHRASELFSSAAQVSPQLIYTSYLRVRGQGAGFAVRSKARVINVDDSPVLLKFLAHGIETFGFVDVIKQVSDSKVAADTIVQLKPDFVTMDIQMPTKNGVQVVREVLERADIPIIMISSLSPDEGSLVFDALNSGAFDYIQKPKLEDKQTFFEDLKAKALLALTSSGAKVTQPASQKAKVRPASEITYADNLIWCIGASTGGTQALTRVMTSLPTKIPPTLVVQHIPPVFSKSFADSLNDLCPFTVKEAENGDVLQPDHVYIAAGGLQLGIEQRGGTLVLALRDDEPVNRFKPSVDYMFNDVQKLRGFQVVAGILTGMGRDGANGLLALHKKGARTFAQDESSSAVFGMPRAAIEIGAADTVVHLDEVAQTLLRESSAKRKAG